MTVSLSASFPLLARFINYQDSLKNHLQYIELNIYQSWKVKPSISFQGIKEIELAMMKFIINDLTI